MTNIKKQFSEIHSVLSNNMDATVSEIFDELVELMSKSSPDKTSEYRDGVLHIYCYYHKQWESVEEVEYGVKKSSSTGYNTMCKTGVNQWTRQQREYKDGQSQLLSAVQAGKIQPSDIAAETAKLEEARNRIEPATEYLARMKAEKEAKAEAKASK